MRQINYTFYWYGKILRIFFGSNRTQLLPFVVNVMEGTTGMFKSTMVLRLNIKSEFFTLISQSKNKFYNQFEEEIKGLAYPECLSTHGIGKLNDKGQRKLEICGSYIFFKGKMLWKVSMIIKY